jgi:hypothetical protein
MRKCTLVFLFLLFFASAASAQTSRSAYCHEHPTDSTKCTAINGTDNNGKPVVIGLPSVCGSADKQMLESNMEAMVGMNEDLFEQAGFCKITHDETTKLLEWHESQRTERLYFRSDDNRPNKRIYVHLDFQSKTTPEIPEILKSAFRDAFRRLSDIELVDGQGDFTVQVLGGVPVTKGSGGPGGTAASYAFAVNALADYREPRFAPQSNILLREQKAFLMNICLAENVDSCVREAAASVDSQAFEDFRKFSPYINSKAKR